MNSLDEDKIESILNLVSEVTYIKFDGLRYIIPSTDENIVKKHGLPFEEYETVIQLMLKTYFGPQLKYSANLNSDIKSSDINGDLFVFDCKGTIIKYTAELNSYRTFGVQNDKLLLYFKNTVEYNKLFNLFKSNNFCDYFNDANNEIVIYSSITGINKIKYLTIPLIYDTVDISTNTTNLIALATPLELQPFLKNAIFSYSNGKPIVQLWDIIEKSNDIITIAKRDYELVSKKFDFEKFRDSLYREKENFFSNIRDVLNKIFSQAIGIPIAISATVFSTYKVADDIFMLAVVLLAFIIYVLFYIKIQLVYNSDLNELKIDFDRDFDQIEMHSGLPASIIAKEKKKIQRRLSNSKTIIVWLIAMIISLGLLVCYYILYEMLRFDVLQLIVKKEMITFTSICGYVYLHLAC